MRPDMGDERLMDRCLQILQTLNILGLLRQERIGETFDRPAVTTRRSILPGHQFGKAERGEDHPDGPDDRGTIDPDLIRRTGQPIAAR